MGQWGYLLIEVFCGTVRISSSRSRKTIKLIRVQLFYYRNFINCHFSSNTVHTPQSAPVRCENGAYHQTSSTGLLTSSQFCDLSVETSPCPWIITVASYEIINITLIDWSFDHQDAGVCVKYADVMELADGARNESVCRGKSRESVAFISETNTVKIVVNSVACSSSRFMFKYQGKCCISYWVTRVLLLSYVIELLVIELSVIESSILSYQLLNYQLLSNQLLSNQLLSYQLLSNQLLSYQLLNYSVYMLVPSPGKCMRIISKGEGVFPRKNNFFYFLYACTLCPLNES